MSSNFLGLLSDQINSQLSIGENINNTLDAVVDGQQVKYGSLANIAGKFDESAQRSYVEEGYLRISPYESNPKQFEILMQEPNATILLKKRMFSSIAENFRPDFMDKDEKLYYKACRVLFQNKCNQIAALEKLSKIQQITSAVGNISDQLVPIIISLSDTATSGLGGIGSGLFGSSALSAGNDSQVSIFTKAIDKLRKLYAFNTTNNYTTWITDPTHIFQSQFGEGTGVIEITNFTNFTTHTTVDTNGTGTFSFSISDPYQVMRITEYDIEKAISDATNAFSNHKILQFGLEGADQVIADNRTKLDQLRANRGASPISIKIDPDTLLGKRVTAIVDRQGLELLFNYNSGFGGIGSSVDVAADYLKGGVALGFDGLATDKIKSLGIIASDTELGVFKKLIAAIFNKISLTANSNNSFQLGNKKTNYARRKMYNSLMGRLIIQPMDIVHIYVNSKSRYDNKILSGINGMLSGVGILQNINNTFTDLTNSITTLFNPDGNVDLQAEKSAYVGKNFPNYLWSLMRNQFVTENEGTHIFAGVVEEAPGSWDGGKYTVNVRGKDNTTYFEMGKVNFKPGVDNFNGSLFDPLTPFKSNFDTISSNAKDETPELLDENKFILGTNQDKDSPLVKFKLGSFAGSRATTDNFIQDRSVDSSTGNLTKIIYGPDGLVYKWKEGIGTLVQHGNPLSLNDPNKVGHPSITNNPFAGQDVMNVISLLITGNPYNFSTYWRAVANLDGFNKDPHSQQNSSYSFYSSLKNDLVKNNVLWGNFIPFKNLVLDEQTFALAMQSQLRVIQFNNDLNNKLKELANLKNQAQLFDTASVLEPSDDVKFLTANQKAKAAVSSLQENINNIITEIQKINTSPVANDPTYGFNTTFDSSQATKQASDNTIRRKLRKELNLLTRRMSYNIRANEDKNLFIVDDNYDKDYDILAYESSFVNGIAQYNNEFASIKDKIRDTAHLLNLEVFCDTQGHVRCRTPQYNRMPSSIFYKMMYHKKASGIQVFPQFLDDIFGNQIKTLTERVEVLEDMIRLDCAILGFNDDASAGGFIMSNGSISGLGDTFIFLSDETSGTITDLQNVIKASNPQEADDKQPTALDTFATTITATVLEAQGQSNKQFFDPTQRFQAIAQSLSDQGLNQAGYGIQDIPKFSTNTVIDDLIHRIQTKSGQLISKTSYLDTTSTFFNGVILPPGQSIDIFKTTQELSDKIRERQTVVKLLYNVVKNATEAKSLDDSGNTANSLLMPGNYSNSNIPEIFEHMIEDESYDDYGPGSGSRYIIKRAQIKQATVSERPPPFTYVEVKGLFNKFAPDNLPNGLNAFAGIGQGGNSMVTAVAIDYDTWRNYGFRNTTTVAAPFLSDPISQCAPYATTILSRARKEVISGTVTISGNEYMQPGEVIFLEDWGLLFYVSSVNHNFTFGQGFSTTLELTYGHAPGEYIPTTLDVIGKLLYNNRDINSFVIQRQSSSFADANIAVVQKDIGSAQVFGTGDANDSISSSTSNANTQAINNILYYASYIINTNQTQGTNTQATVELRIYHDDNNDADSDLSAFAETVKNILIGIVTGPKQPFNITGQSTNPTLKKPNVQVVPINLDTDSNSPSQKAMDLARNLMGTTGLSGGAASLSDLAGNVATSVVNTVTGNSATGSPIAAQQYKDKIRSALYKLVLDCWIKFDPVSSTSPDGSSPDIHQIEAAYNS